MKFSLRVGILSRFRSRGLQAAVETFNEYRFTSLDSLRAALRSFKVLEAMGDTTSVTILLDLRRALGDDPNFTTPIITDHQRTAIQLLLIEDLPVKEVAAKLGVVNRVVLYAVNRGLKSILAFLQGEHKVIQCQPWMFEVMRNAELTAEEIAPLIGKTPRAVKVLMSRYRESERIPYRTRRRSVADSQSAGQ